MRYLILSIFLITIACACATKDRRPALLDQFELDEQDQIIQDLFLDPDEIDEKAQKEGRCSRCPAKDADTPDFHH
jgi:hypothetical protein